MYSFTLWILLHIFQIIVLYCSRMYHKRMGICSGFCYSRKRTVPFFSSWRHSTTWMCCWMSSYCKDSRLRVMFVFSHGIHIYCFKFYQNLLFSLVFCQWIFGQIGCQVKLRMKFKMIFAWYATIKKHFEKPWWIVRFHC